MGLARVILFFAAAGRSCGQKTPARVPRDWSGSLRGGSPRPREDNHRPAIRHPARSCSLLHIERKAVCAPATHLAIQDLSRRNPFQPFLDLADQKRRPAAAGFEKTEPEPLQFVHQAGKHNVGKLAHLGNHVREGGDFIGLQKNDRCPLARCKNGRRGHSRGGRPPRKPVDTTRDQEEEGAPRPAECRRPCHGSFGCQSRKQLAVSFSVAS